MLQHFQFYGAIKSPNTQYIIIYNTCYNTKSHYTNLSCNVILTLMRFIMYYDLSTFLSRRLCIIYTPDGFSKISVKSNDVWRGSFLTSHGIKFKKHLSNDNSGIYENEQTHRNLQWIALQASVYLGATAE